MYTLESVCASIEAKIDRIRFIAFITFVGSPTLTTEGFEPPDIFWAYYYYYFYYMPKNSTTPITIIAAGKSLIS
jgi:hypothetical protein